MGFGSGSGVNGGGSMSGMLVPGVALERSIESISDQATADALAYAALAKAHINHPQSNPHANSQSNPHTNSQSNFDPSNPHNGSTLLKGGKKKVVGENSMKWKQWRDEKILRDLQLSRYDPIRDCGKPLDDMLDLTMDGTNKITIATKEIERKRNDVEGFLSSLPSNVRRQQQHGIVGKQKRNLIGKLLVPMSQSMVGNGVALGGGSVHDYNIMTPLEVSNIYPITTPSYPL